MTYEEIIADLRQQIAQITSNLTGSREKRFPFTEERETKKYDENHILVNVSRQQYRYEIICEWDAAKQQWVEKETVQVWP